MSRSLRFALGAGALMAATVLSAAPALADSGGSTTTSGDGITKVTVSPARASLESPVTVTVSFCLPKDSKPGSTIKLTVPKALVPLTTGFLLSNAQQQLVAVGTVADQVVTLTTGPFVASDTSLCGLVAFPANVVQAAVHLNADNTVDFESAGTLLPVSFTPVVTVGAKPSEPITYGIWTNPADQGRATRSGALTWYLESAQAAEPSGASSVTFVDTPTAGQSVVCKSARIELGKLDQYNHFVFVQSYTGSMQVTCSTARVTVTMGDLAAGTVARLVVHTTPATTAPSSFGNIGNVSMDGDDPVAVIANKVKHFGTVGTVSGKAVIGVPTGAATSSAPTSPAPSLHPVPVAKAEASGPSGSALALLIGLCVVGAGMIGTALRARKATAE